MEQQTSASRVGCQLLPALAEVENRFTIGPRQSTNPTKVQPLSNESRLVPTPIPPPESHYNLAADTAFEIADGKRAAVMAVQKSKPKDSPRILEILQDHNARRARQRVSESREEMHEAKERTQRLLRENRELREKLESLKADMKRIKQEIREKRAAMRRIPEAVTWLKSHQNPN